MSRASSLARPSRQTASRRRGRTEGDMASAAMATRDRGGSADLRPALFTIGRFFLMVAATLLGLLAVTFFIGRVMPIDPVIAIVGDRAPEHVYQRVRQELGLDLPLFQQFWIYCRKAVMGDFG